MYVTLHNIQLPSAQILILIAFFDAFFQDLINLMTREKQVDKLKVCGEPDFFPCMHRPRGL